MGMCVSSFAEIDFQMTLYARATASKPSGSEVRSETNHKTTVVARKQPQAYYVPLHSITYANQR
jgi:hypothetical protein